MGCRQKCSFDNRDRPHLLNSSLVWLWDNRGRCLQGSAMPQLHARRQIYQRSEAGSIRKGVQHLGDTRTLVPAWGKLSASRASRCAAQEPSQ